MREHDEFAEQIQRRADRITSLILFSDMPWVDIAIEIQNLREWCARYLPDKLELFDRIYVSRFQRLWTQWRQTEYTQFY
ncbi:hypothetical protein J7M23_04325, partial [Candidatus Sumerlaeota bacterium]|nr:hypothetical protein [Candidatus Sumerlaeota bacterium]